MSAPRWHVTKRGRPKRRYFTLFDAEEVADRLTLRRGNRSKVRYDAYLCRHCRWYHVGRRGARHLRFPPEAVEWIELGERAATHLNGSDTLGRIRGRFRTASKLAARRQENVDGRA